MKRLFLLVIASAISFLCAAQNDGSITKTGSLRISRDVRPPILKVVDLSFEDPSGNNAIDAAEECFIIMEIRNEGFGDGVGMVGEITCSDTCGAFSFAPVNIPLLEVGKSYKVRFPIRASTSISDSSVEFDVSVYEPNGFGTDIQHISVKANSLTPPMIEVVDIVCRSNDARKLKKMEIFSLNLLLQNTGPGTALGVEALMELPDGVFLMDGNLLSNFAELQSGEEKLLEYKLIVNNSYSENQIPLHINLSEKFGKFSKDSTIILELNQQLDSRNIFIDARSRDVKQVSKASLLSDVDKNIPQWGAKRDNRFAIIVGNEDYCSYQTDLSAGSHVEFAINDAITFKDYCINVFGVPEENTILLTNAGSVDMRREIARISKLISLSENSPELIFYYAGHGLTDESGDNCYLIPVDVSQADISNGIRLSDLYSMIGCSGASRVTIFLDACFSGNSRNSGLVPVRGVKVGKGSEPIGNMLVFCATQEDQTALSYRDKQHGMFTYFLLKKLQESKGNCSYEELADYVISKVKYYSVDKNYVNQEPQILCSDDILDYWRDWNIN